MKKIIIAGGSGFIGKALQQHYQNQGNLVIILGRKNSKPHYNELVEWDGIHLDQWKSHLENATILINLSGKSVDCRYTEKNKMELINSRIQSTRVLQEAVNMCQNPPKLWLNASTATIYEDSRNEINTENSTRLGIDFSMSLAKKWEEVFFETPSLQTRKVALRMSLVLSNEGGVLPILTRLAKFGFGGKMGDGQQKFAHITITELIEIIDFIETNSTLEGPVNCTNTNYLTNEQFMKQLREKNNIKWYFNIPEWLLSIGGKIIGTEKELILKSRYVAPQKLIDAGFKFNH